MSKPCVFLRYSKHQSFYYCHDLITQRIYTSRHVLFNETIFPMSSFFSIDNKHLDQVSSLLHDLTIPVTITISSSPTFSTLSQQAAPFNYSYPLSSITVNSLTSLVNSTNNISQTLLPIKSTQRTHPMITRLQNNISKPKKKKMLSATKHQLRSSIEPTFPKQAIQDPLWKQAMLDEIAALQNNKTWDLFPPPPNHTIIGCK